MFQIALYVLFLAAGGLIVLFIYQSRLKKITHELNQKVNKVKSSVSPGPVSTNSDSTGIFNDLIAIGNNIENLVANRKENKTSQKEDTEDKSEIINLRIPFHLYQVHRHHACVVLLSLVCQLPHIQ